jgi:phosphatidate cytidylyltransferase
LKLIFHFFKDFILSELLKRVIVALIAIPLAIFIIFLGGWIFNIVVLGITLVTLWEYYKIAEKKQAFPNKYIGMFFGGMLILIVAYFPLIQAGLYSIYFLMIFGLIVLISELWKKKPNNNLNISTTISGVLYISLSFSFLILLRHLYNDINFLQNSTIDFVRINSPLLLAKDSESAWLVLSILISIWICDTAAFFAGKGFGKHKLFERISPKKTWEGAIAGFIFGIIAFWASAEILIKDFPLIHSVVIGLIVGTFGQIGDLAESQLKRDAMIKDSSAIIPGHGGFLDRFDSILFVMPLVYIYLILNIIYFT